jgi:uroporphyrinogen III methyltransferase/synthase
MNKLRFGTRGSKLALHQTRLVISQMQQAFPELLIEEVIIKTLGDRVTDRPLFKVGGQGLFIKEIEDALLRGDIDLAVHSLKDLPHALSPGLTLGAISKREDARDVLISRQGVALAQLPQGAVLGTSSLRRRAQLCALRPDIRFSDLRGNLDTRLAKLENGEMDGIILAAAGLCRLGLQGCISEFLSPEQVIPAAGQGLLGIECLSEQRERLLPFLTCIEHPEGRIAADAERAFLKELQGGCQVPLGVYARRQGDSLDISGFIAKPDGSTLVRSAIHGSCSDAERLGAELARALLNQGGVAILEAWRASIQSRSQRLFDTFLHKKGRVFLVGAGPGDPGLITVKGLELVKKADVIVYDQLGAPAFLRHARPDAELIDAGKRAGDHTLPQDQINATLLKKAQAGHLVVRLKGGDPMIFGRGGEEAEYLLANGVRCEIVPGVSSSIAGPSYAGIPLSHRSFTSEIAIVTGHEADLQASPSSPDATGARRSGIPWEALAQLRSIVFLMGVKQLPAIVERLSRAGKPLDTPVAMIENATLPKQRTICGTLQTIVALAHEAEIKPPALIVVGEAVSLQPRLKWFENRPLSGRRILVTRSRKQASDLVANLEELGAEVFSCPTIRTERLWPNPLFDACLRSFHEVGYLVFTSTNGVEGFMENLYALGHDVRLLAGKKIICIGPATAEVFRSHGIRPDFVPATYVAESLLPYFEQQPPARVALMRAEKAREVLPQALSKIGWQVEIVPLYQTLGDAPDDPNIINLLQQQAYDAVTFTSSSTVDHFMELIAGKSVLPQTVKGVSIGPVTSDTCRENGINLLATADEYTIPGLVRKLLELFAHD